MKLANSIFAFPSTVIVTAPSNFVAFNSPPTERVILLASLLTNSTSASIVVIETEPDEEMTLTSPNVDSTVGL